MKTVEVTLVRHAQTVANASGIWQGQGDSRLSEVGRSQAARWGSRLAGGTWDRVIASDLRRTRDTAECLGWAGIALDPAWREVDVGAWEGLTREEVKQRFADEILALQRGEPVKIGGGESWAELEARVDRALAGLVDELGHGARALVVTHGGVIHAIVSGLLGLRGRRFRPIGRVMNTAITTLRLRGRPGAPGAAVEVVAFNDASHVGPRSEYLEDLLAAGGGALAMLAASPGGLDGVRRWYPDLAPSADAAEPSSEPGDAPASPLDALRPQATPGGVRGLTVDGARAAALAHAALGAREGVAVTALGAGRVAHLVWTAQGPVLGDYGLGPDGPAAGGAEDPEPAPR